MKNVSLNNLLKAFRFSCNLSYKLKTPCASQKVIKFTFESSLLHASCKHFSLVIIPLLLSETVGKCVHVYWNFTNIITFTASEEKLLTDMIVGDR